MLLARVNPNAPGIDEITYECRDCNTAAQPPDVRYWG